MEPKLVVVFLDAEEVGYQFPEWPVEISLAICLLPKGDFHFVILHEKEVGSFPNRLAAQLGFGRCDILVSPVVDGYVTRTMLFSEMQLIWSLVSEANGALEEAIDYEANYRFALEEGLDPFKFLGVPGLPDDKGTHTQAGSYRPTPKSLGDDTKSWQEIAVIPHRRGRTDKAKFDKALLPGFLDKEKSKPGPGYFKATEIKATPPREGEFSMLAKSDGCLLIRKCGEITSQMKVETADKVFVESNLGGLAIRCDHAGAGVPDQIELEPDMVPEAVRQIIGAGQSVVQVFRAGWFINVLFDSQSSGPIVRSSRMYQMA